MCLNPGGGVKMLEIWESLGQLVSGALPAPPAATALSQLSQWFSEKVGLDRGAFILVKNRNVLSLTSAREI